MDSDRLNADLMQSTGSTVETADAEYLGEIAEVVCGNKNENIQYVILKSDIFFDERERFFAIQSTPELLKIKGDNKVTLLAEIVDLQLARTIEAKKCSKSISQFQPSICELRHYKSGKGKGE